MSILSATNQTLFCHTVRVYPLSLQSTSLVGELFNIYVCVRARVLTHARVCLLKIIFNIDIIYKLLEIIK